MTCKYYECYYCFFFQAEDGIRDLVRSRGLGDVYKRQELARDVSLGVLFSRDRMIPMNTVKLLCLEINQEAVSYTHLTLPTSDLV